MVASWVASWTIAVYEKFNIVVRGENKLINLSDFYKETSTQLITKSGDFTQKVIEVTFKRRLFSLNWTL